MKAITLFAILGCFLASGAVSKASKFPKHPVVKLTNENFYTETQNGIWMVKFYVNWCHQCKLIEETWEDLADKSKGLFHVGEVNCEEEKELAERFKVSSFPTILFFQPGEAPKEVRTYRSVYDWLRYVSYYSTYKDLYNEYTNIGPDYKTKPHPKPNPKPMPKKAKSGWSDEPARPGSAVLEMDSDNFDATVAQDPSAPMIVKFYAPWCMHCQDLAPKWEDLAAEAKKLGRKWRVGKVNADRDEALSAKFNIRSYPTIYVVQAGKEPQMYTGPRTVKALMEHMDKLVPVAPPPPTTTTTTTAAAEKEEETEGKDEL